MHNHLECIVKFDIVKSTKSAYILRIYIGKVESGMECQKPQSDKYRIQVIIKI